MPSLARLASPSSRRIYFPSKPDDQSTASTPLPSITMHISAYKNRDYSLSRLPEAGRDGRQGEHHYHGILPC